MPKSKSIDLGVLQDTLYQARLNERKAKTDFEKAGLALERAQASHKAARAALDNGFRGATSEG